ncbi:snoRNA-binding protein [Sorochytrium milnesiophthora]
MAKDGKKSKKSDKPNEAAAAAAATAAATVPTTDANAMAVDAVEEGAPTSRLLAPIASPLATDKLTKKLLKAVKRAAKDKKVRRGVKEVSKGLRKGEKGIVILAGDISPIDVISHLPVLCEDHDVQYVFVPSKAELGTAGSTKRPTSVVLVSDKCEGEAKEALTECQSETKKLTYVR